MFISLPSVLQELRGMGQHQSVKYLPSIRDCSEIVMKPLGHASHKVPFRGDARHL